MNNVIKKNLFTEFEIDKLPIEEQKGILLKMNEIVLKGVMSKAVDSLSKNDLDLIEKKVSEGMDEVSLLNLLQEKVANFNNLVDQEIDELKKVFSNILVKMKDKENK